MAWPRKEGEEERRGREEGREGRGAVVVEEVRRRFRAVRTQVGLLARVGTRRRAKAGRAAVWRSKEALDANIGAWGGGGEGRSTALSWNLFVLVLCYG